MELWAGLMQLAWRAAALLDLLAAATGAGIVAHANSRVAMRQEA